MVFAKPPGSSIVELPQVQSGLRVALREPRSPGGFIDGAWWPRSLDLDTELPPLLEHLWANDYQVNRLGYNLAAWDAAPRKMSVAGRVVRLGGFATSDPHTVRLTDARGSERLDIFVVRPESHPDLAIRVLDVASRTDGLLKASEIWAQVNGSNRVTDNPD